VRLHLYDVEMVRTADDMDSSSNACTFKTFPMVTDRLHYPDSRTCPCVMQPESAGVDEGRNVAAEA
jgi:hypothetical protein